MRIVVKIGTSTLAHPSGHLHIRRVETLCKIMSDIKNAVPAFLVLIMMPLTYSIANGIGIGAIAYTLIALFSGKYNKKDIAVTVIAILFVCKFIFGTI